MTTYAERRKDLTYYKILKELMKDYRGETLIDVGNEGTDVVTYGNFKERIAVNLTKLPEREGIQNVIGDWVDVSVPFADLVTCCQVLEHLTDEQLPPFVDKLFSHSKHVIITVPYLWEKGQCEDHKQDPINHVKLYKMVQRVPTRTILVQETKGPKRLIAIYRNKT